MQKYLLLLFLLIFGSVISVSKSQSLNLTVIDVKSKLEVSQYLLKSTNDPLELTCKLQNISDEQVSLSWVLPFPDLNRTVDDDEESPNTTASYVIQTEAPENGTTKLFINSLQMSHSGSFVCVAISNSSGTSYQTVKLIVKQKKVVCGKKFDCGDNQCISIIYKCDGVPDCKSKMDEAHQICGLNPCVGRLPCDNGRCIPTEWCKVCDPLKTNCTNKHRHDCCPSLEVIASFKSLIPYNDGSYSRRFSDFPGSDLQHQYDINFIHSTIYTIIGCAIVFMIIVTILVLAMCRIYWKRPPPPHISNNRRVYATTAYHRAFTQEIGVYDLDIAMNRSEGPGLLVTYNINNGVQIVGNPVDPPPYSEIASLPPREGPPPPYAVSSSCEGENLPNVRSVQCETSPKPGNIRRGLTNQARVASEPSLPNLHRM